MRRSSARRPSFEPGLALAMLLACAGPRQPWRETRPAEVLVEVLPQAAVLSLDGAPLGPGPGPFPSPDPVRRYRFRAARQGSGRPSVEAEGARLAGRAGRHRAPPAGPRERPAPRPRRRRRPGRGGGAAGAHRRPRSRGSSTPSGRWKSGRTRPADSGPWQTPPWRSASRAGPSRRTAPISGWHPRRPDREAVSRRVEALRGDWHSGGRSATLMDTRITSGKGRARSRVGVVTASDSRGEAEDTSGA